MHYLTFTTWVHVLRFVYDYIIIIKHHQNFYCWSESETTGSLISVYYDVTVHSIFNQFEQVSITFHMYLLP